MFNISVDAIFSDHIVETSQEKHIFNERDILYTGKGFALMKLLESHCSTVSHSFHAEKVLEISV